MPAYRAEGTLEKTVAEIPAGVADTIILVDDASPDNTVELARELGITVFVHLENRGYGGNQKTCYRRALEEGAGSIVDIDRGMTLGCGHPMGPLTLLDLVGLDTTYFIANIMFEEFRETRFAPPPLLKRMVHAGYHGRKTGRGFYDYSVDPPRPNDELTGRDAGAGRHS